MRSRRHDQRGVAMVEFALVVLPMCLLLMGAMDWGWAFMMQSMVTNAARDGARTASTYATAGGTSCTTAQTAGAAQEMNALPANIQSKVTAHSVVCAPATGSLAGNNLATHTASITVTYNRLTGFAMYPLPGCGMGNNSCTATATAVMVGP